MFMLTKKGFCNKRGRIFVLSSPSGGGKTTLCNRLKRERFNIKYSVSATTRARRKDEVNGRDYFFLKREDFMRLAKKGKFLEWTDNFGSLYGTLKAPVEKTISKGFDIILSIDVKGAMQVKKIYPDAILIFLLPPSLDRLRKRLKKRKTESGEMLKQRLKVAKRELAYLSRYNYVIINDRLKKALDVLKSIIIAERNRILA